MSFCGVLAYRPAPAHNHIWSEEGEGCDQRAGADPGHDLEFRARAGGGPSIQETGAIGAVVAASRNGKEIRRAAAGRFAPGSPAMPVPSQANSGLPPRSYRFPGRPGSGSGTGEVMVCADADCGTAGRRSGVEQPEIPSCSAETTSRNPTARRERPFSPPFREGPAFPSGPTLSHRRNPRARIGSRTEPPAMDEFRSGPCPQENASAGPASLPSGPASG